MTPVTRTTRSLRGFSLVEVTIAMGIVATVLIALLALLPYGMDNVRAAKATMVESRIANEIIGELQVADWGEMPSYRLLDKYNELERRYDSDGTLIPANGNRADTIYKARIEVNSRQPSHLPGQSLKSEGVYLRKVTVKIGYAPGDRDVNWTATKLPLPYKSYTTEVVKLARDEIDKKK